MKQSELFSRSFLFKGIPDEEIFLLLKENQPIQEKYKKGDLIYSSDSQSRLVGFVLSGECEVRRDRGKRDTVLLNTLVEGDSFGIISVFSEEEFPTLIFAAKNCEILFFTDRQINSFIASSPVISRNIIRFLSGRISFLNKRIATFSGKGVEDRLASYLAGKSKESATTILTFSYVKCSEEINAGRASVYRAIAALESEGLIKTENKKILILDPDGLERLGAV